MTHVRVLVAEDEEQLRETLFHWLTQNYMVTTCDNRQDALDKLSKQHYDLIVLDVGIPIIDGFELCR